MMKKYLKKAKPIQSFFSFSYFGSMLLIASLIIISSCKDDDDDAAPASTAFADASSETTEIATDATTINISLPFAVAAPGGTIDVTFDAANAAAFTSVPAATNGTITLTIAAGATEASFTVTPVDNDAFGDNVVVVFTLGNPTGTLILGTDVNYTFTINNDEIAWTSFEEPNTAETPIGECTFCGDDSRSGTGYIEATTVDPQVAHQLENNDLSEQDVAYTSVGTELGFSTMFSPFINLFTGNNETGPAPNGGLSLGADERAGLGVTKRLQDNGNPGFFDVGNIDGYPTAFPDGAKAYEMGQVEGVATLTLDEVALSGFGNYNVSIDVFFREDEDGDYRYFPNDHRFNAGLNDYVRIFVLDDQGTKYDIINSTNDDFTFPNNAYTDWFEIRSELTYEGNAVVDTWTTMSTTVPGTATSLTVVAEYGSDLFSYGGGYIVLDNVVIKGAN